MARYNIVKNYVTQKVNTWLDELQIFKKFTPAIIGGIYVNPVERYLLLLPAKYGGLGIPIFSELAGTEF